MAKTLPNLPITITAGKKLKTISLTWGTRDSVTGVVTPYSATGYVLRIKIRATALSETVIASFTSVGGEHLGGAEGTVTLAGAVTNNIVLNMTATESAKLQGMAGTYWYDCDWGPTGQDPEPFFEGPFNVRDEYTR